MTLARATTTCAMAVAMIVPVGTLAARARSASQGTVPRPATGTISGTVMSTESNPQPIPRAVVMLTGGGITNNLSTVSDLNGQFQFADLTPGRYSLTVSKPAYLTMAYGATRPGRLGTSVALAAGQQLSVRIVLPRGAVITGTIRDQFGAPASSASVTVMRPESPGSAGGFRTVYSATTDDRGVYRVFGLMPDEYVVSVSVSRMIMLPGNDMVAPSRAVMDARLRALELRNVAPVASSPGVASIAPPAAKTEPVDPSGSQVLSWVPTYYPGTAVASEAMRIRVGAGEERSNVDVVLAPVRAARVSGLVQSGGVPLQRIRMSLSTAESSLSTLMNNPGIQPDGTFTFSNVAPGRYRLMAQTTVVAAGRGGAAPVDDVPPLVAALDITVNGVDIAGLVLGLRPATTISGRVAFDATTKPAPRDASSVRVAISTAASESGIMINGLVLGAPSSTVKSDGTFQINNVLPGSYMMSATLQGWWLRSAIVNGRDVLDFPLDIDASTSDITDAVVTFSDRRAELYGTLVTASGQPASEMTVVVYPADRGMWRPGARRIRSVRPGTDGAFSVPDLPGGEYLVAAVTDADPDEWQRPSFLEQLLPASVKVTIADGARVRQDLRIAK